MTKTRSSSPQGSFGSRQFDFDALYRAESPGEGMAPMTTPPWDNQAPSESVIGWQTGGWVHGDVLDIGCGLGDNAVYLAKTGYTVTGLDISPTALITAEQRAADAGVDVKFAVADSTKLDGYTDAFDTVIDRGMFHGLDDDGRRSYATAVHRAAARVPPCCSAASPKPTRWARTGDRRCPKRRCATSSAMPAGTSRRWCLPRCPANWTARQSKWRSGTSARNGARAHRAKLTAPTRIIAAPATLPPT